MKKRHFFETMTKSLVAELNRLFWNKDKTITGFNISKGDQKAVVKVEFPLSAPFSQDSSILIIVRFNGDIERWIKVFDDKTKKPEKSATISLFGKSEDISISEAEIKGIAKQLLKEISG